MTLLAICVAAGILLGAYLARRRRRALAQPQAIEAQESVQTIPAQKSPLIHRIHRTLQKAREAFLLVGLVVCFAALAAGRMLAFCAGKLLSLFTVHPSPRNLYSIPLLFAVPTETRKPAHLEPGRLRLVRAPSR